MFRIFFSAIRDLHALDLVEDVADDPDRLIELRAPTLLGVHDAVVEFRTVDHLLERLPRTFVKVEFLVVHAKRFVRLVLRLQKFAHRLHITSTCCRFPHQIRFDIHHRQLHSLHTLNQL